MNATYEVKTVDERKGVTVYVAATRMGNQIVTRLYERTFRDYESARRHAARLQSRIDTSTL